MNKFQTIALSLLIIAGTNITTCALAAPVDTEEKDPDYIMDTSKIGNTDNGYVRSEQFLELGSPTPSALSMEGAQSLRSGSIDRALTVLQRAVEMAPLDLDNRILYAETLEKKLMSDPKLFNFIVKQWFFIYQKAEFYDHKYAALNHLVDLTGTQPKRFENAQKFLARVILPTDGSVKVAMGGPKVSDAKKNSKKAKIDKNNIDPDADIRHGKKDVSNDVWQ